MSTATATPTIDIPKKEKNFRLQKEDRVDKMHEYEHIDRSAESNISDDKLRNLREAFRTFVRTNKDILLENEVGVPEGLFISIELKEIGERLEGENSHLQSTLKKLDSIDGSVIRLMSHNYDEALRRMKLPSESQKEYAEKQGISAGKLREVHRSFNHLLKPRIIALMCGSHDKEMSI